MASSSTTPPAVAAEIAELQRQAQGHEAAAASQRDEAKSRFLGLSPGDARTVANAEEARRSRGEVPALQTPGAYTEPWARAHQQSLNAAKAQEENVEDGGFGVDADPAAEDVETDEAAEAGRTLSRLQRARSALLRTGLHTEATLAQMPRKEILRLGGKAQKRQETANRSDANAGGQAAQKAAPGSGQGTTRSRDGKPQSEAPAQSFDESRLAKHLESLDDKSKAALKAVVGEVVQHFEGRIADVAQPGEHSPAHEAADALDDIRGDAQARWPAVADDDVYESVKSAAEQFLALPVYQGLDAEEAARQAFDAACAAQGLERVGGLDPLRAARRAGQAIAPHSTMVTTRPKDAYSASKAAFMHLGRHPGDVIGANRAAGRLS